MAAKKKVSRPATRPAAARRTKGAAPKSRKSRAAAAPRRKATSARKAAAKKTTARSASPAPRRTAAARKAAAAAPRKATGKPPVVGDMAPEFALRDQTGRTVMLSDYRGRKLLLYFYPKADTPGCTVQSCSVRDARAGLARGGVEVLGISPDEPGAQSRFDDKFGLGFPLLSDPDRSVATRYGAFGEKVRYGKKVMGIIRSSFLVGENGRILGAWRSVKPEDTVPKAEALLSGR